MRGMQVQINKRATMTKPKRGPLPLSSELRQINLELVEKHYARKPKPPYTVLLISDTPDLILREICTRLQRIETRTILCKTLTKNAAALQSVDLEADCVFMDQAIGSVKPVDKQKVFNVVFRILKYRGLLVTTQRESFKENNTGFVPTFMADTPAPFPVNPYPCNPTALRNLLYNAGFDPIYETCRWLQFSAYACVKGSSKGVHHAR